LLITDCHMPEIDGYELTKRVRVIETEQGKPRLPIVALTGDALAGAAQYCLDVGMDDYLSKPVAIDLLDEAVQRWLPAASGLRRPVEAAPTPEATPNPAPVAKDPAPAAIMVTPAPVVIEPAITAPPLQAAVLRDIFGALNEDSFKLYHRFIDQTGVASQEMRAALGNSDFSTATSIAERGRLVAECVGAGELAQIYGLMLEQLHQADPAAGQWLERMNPALNRARQSLAQISNQAQV
jgi:HPt (histidine-containing phosphotransfer) domain-containing protein